MKTKLIVIAAFCFLANVVNALSDVPSFTITRKGDASRGIFMVNYRGVKITAVTLVVKDRDGKEILTKSIKSAKDFSVPLNFSSVDEGTYTITIDNGSEKLSQTLNYTNEKAPTYSHVANLGNGRYLFTTSSAGSEKINLRIYNGDEEMIYEKELTIKGESAMLFDLKEVTGTPFFEVSEDAGTFLMVPREPLVVSVKK
jgi:hypothetical protein